MNRAARRAYAREVVKRRNPDTGIRASGREVQVARSLYARYLNGNLMMAQAEPPKLQSWVDRFRKRVLGR